ncbi:polymeric immunoglobulin receptor-like [Garra rufa]|uniref:polymeric immunoglobulin receptor-like n=1 Tax=Garra rufa TaxID=137080 RepID=UPI003CCE8930
MTSGVTLKTLDHVIMTEGGSITIPCLYDNQYKLNSKYWCKGFTWEICQNTASGNDAGKWTINDYPADNLFTVQLNNAKSSDSGRYWCAVEIGSHADEKKPLYLTVQKVPDVSVVNSSVSGHKGGNVSVQCLYSSGYKNKVKQWCRYKDQSCYTVGRTDTSQNSSAQISEDGRRSFTVLIIGLRLNDSGWYFCSVGDQQVPVQLTVTEDPQVPVLTVPETKPGVKGWSNYILTIQTGGSVTIPCHYDKKYTQQKKYWHSGIDKSKTYTNTTEENLTVIDLPDQSLFTVTMRNLQDKHIGRYCCVVETGEQPLANVIYEPYLKIQSAPDVSVVSSSVSGQEGGDISIQCLYSSGYQNEVKHWCRYKDQSCYTVGRTDTSQNSSVQISDDGRRSFTVLMTGLRLTDSGWYFCSVGDLQVPVQLSVTKAKPKSPDVSVVSSSVSGHEGGDISVQCFYSSGYNRKLKQWCRYKDQSCYKEMRTDTSQNSSVQIKDDGKSSFTVLMTGLRLTDSGWYFCSVGETLNPVHLTVVEAKPDTVKVTSYVERFCLPRN